MDKLDIILWVMGGGFGLMLIMWNNLNNRIDNLNNRIDSVNINLANKIEKLDEKVTDIVRRLCRLEEADSK